MIFKDLHVRTEKFWSKKNVNFKVEITSAILKTCENGVNLKCEFREMDVVFQSKICLIWPSIPIESLCNINR